MDEDFNITEGKFLLENREATMTRREKIVTWAYKCNEFFLLNWINKMVVPLYTILDIPHQWNKTFLKWIEIEVQCGEQ